MFGGHNTDIQGRMRGTQQIDELRAYMLHKTSYRHTDGPQLVFILLLLC